MRTSLVSGAVVLLALFLGIAPASAERLAQASDEATLEQQNKTIVARIYDEVFNQDDTVAANQVFAADLVQHDPAGQDGVNGQLALFDTLRTNMPGVVATVKHIAAEGDLVAVHWQASPTPDDEFSGRAVIDLWRLTDGQVVEHWDGFQPVPPSSASGNSMFSDVYVYPQAAPTLSEDQEDANRQMVESAITDLYNNADVAVLDQVFDPRYYQHNPNGLNGAAGLAALGNRLQSLPPASGPRLTVTQSLADGDIVVLIHDGPGGSIDGDIFRVVDGKIIEHWDVLPPAQTS